MMHGTINIKCSILQYVYVPLHVSSIICSSSGGWVVLMQNLVSSLFYHRNFLAARQGWWQIKVLYNIQYMFTGFISRHVRMEHYGSLPYVPEHNHENIDKSFQWPSTLDYILWNNQQMQLYAVNFIPLLGSLYTFRVFYTPIIRSTIYNCIYSHWYKP